MTYNNCGMSHLFAYETQSRRTVYIEGAVSVEILVVAGGVLACDFECVLLQLYRFFLMQMSSCVASCGMLAICESPHVFNHRNIILHTCSSVFVLSMWSGVIAATAISLVLRLSGGY